MTMHITLQEYNEVFLSIIKTLSNETEFIQMRKTPNNTKCNSSFFRYLRLRYMYLFEKVIFLQGTDVTVQKPQPLSSHTCAQQGVLLRPTLYVLYK